MNIIRNNDEDSPRDAASNYPSHCLPEHKITSHPQIIIIQSENPVFHQHYTTLHKALRIITDSMEEVLHQERTKFEVMGENTSTTITNTQIDLNNELQSRKWNQNTQQRTYKKNQNARKNFNTEELHSLDKEFNHNPYPSNSEFDRIARETGIERRRLVVFFQNQRTRRGVTRQNTRSFNPGCNLVTQLPNVEPPDENNILQTSLHTQHKHFKIDNHTDNSTTPKLN